MATLSAKIDAGYLLQIYPKESQTLLHKLRDIRNDAAHETSGVNFETQSIRDRCENLAPLVDDAEFQNVKHWFGLNRVAAELAPQSLWPPQEYRAITDEGEVETNTVGWGYDDARSCFIAGLKSQIFHLHQVTRIFEGIRLVLPPLPDTPK